MANMRSTSNGRARSPAASSTNGGGCSLRSCTAIMGARPANALPALGARPRDCARDDLHGDTDRPARHDEIGPQDVRLLAQDDDADGKEGGEGGEEGAEGA